jgi:hypothetical protein
MSLPNYNRDAQAGQGRWRLFEQDLLDHFGRNNGLLRNICSRSYVVAEFHDDTTGELLATHTVVDIEALARDLAHAERETLNEIRDRVWHE